MVWLFAVTTMLDATNSVGYWEHKKWTLVGFFFMLINKHLVYAVCYALSSFNLFPNFLVQTKMECCFLLSLSKAIFLKFVFWIAKWNHVYQTVLGLGNLVLLLFKSWRQKQLSRNKIMSNRCFNDNVTKFGIHRQRCKL